MSHPTQPIPVLATIRDWCVLSSMGRSAAFKAIREGMPAFRPSKRKTLIPVAEAMAWLRQHKPQ